MRSRDEVFKDFIDPLIRMFKREGERLKLDIRRLGYQKEQYTESKEWYEIEIAQRELDLADHEDEMVLLHGSIKPLKVFLENIRNNQNQE